MFFTCEECDFLFYRAGEVLECPSCNGSTIRTATKEEIHALREHLENQ